jgi:hypothetical protein
MTKRTGLGHEFYADGYKLSGGINAVQEAGGGAAPLDYTAINQDAMDRLGGIRDGRLAVRSFLDGVAGSAHVRFSGMSYNNQTLTYCAGTALGSPAICMVAKQANYDLTRAQDGSAIFETQAQASGYGLEFGDLLTAAERTDTGATSGASYDFTAASSFGLQAYLQVISFTGTDATIKIQSSSDNGGADAWADVTGGGFTAVTTGPQAQRIQTARNLAVERYLRVVTTTSGGFSSLVFVVAVVKNPVEVTF